MKTQFHWGLTCVAMAALVTVAGAQQNQGGGTASKLSMADQRFMKEAAQGGMAEVQLGELAVQKASSDEVKKFGQRMVDDHSKANDNLKALATSKGVTLPQAPDAKEEATKDRLSKLSGEQFDKAYMSDMVRDHKKDVAAFETESTGARDADVRNFATDTLPTLRDHLKNAQDIAPKVMQARGSIEPKSSQ